MTYAKAFLWIGSVVMVGAAIAIQYSTPAGHPPPAGGAATQRASSAPRQAGRLGSPPASAPGHLVSSTRVREATR